MASLTNESAASSSSSSLPLSFTHHQNHYTYEVFLSFRGEDTRFNFTDHLHTALCQRGIETFRDDKLRRGEDISQELLKAIEESRVSIIVFSQNYASSRWCLDELVKILECRKSKGQEVISVFYKVDPSDVRHQRGAFGDAFATLDQCKYKDSMDKWREALSDAANLSGWPYQEDRSEAEFIKEIVGDLSARIVNPSCVLQVAAHPIGIDSCRQDVNRLLDVEENNMVGVWGPGGIGKTTIAKAVLNSIHHKFEGSCFLANVRSKSSSIGHQCLAQLQETLLFDILKDPNLKVSNVDQGVSFIKTRMRHIKVLLILDDVSDSSQLQNLVPSPDCFGPGSRILITTRDEHLLTTHKVQSIYKVKMLNDAEALELFSWNAFQCNGPPNDFVELANRAVSYAQGLPLALIVVGSHLFARSKEQWDDALDSYKRVPHKKIQDILKISFDALEEDYVKELFLDLACFFNGKDIDDVLPILVACHHNPIYGIELLKEKALITMDECYIWMHDLIEEMGKEIVRQEGELGESSRLWKCDDVDHVLTDNIGTKKIKGIQVEGQEGERIRLNAKIFSKMKNLKYLVSKYHAKSFSKMKKHKYLVSKYPVEGKRICLNAKSFSKMKNLKYLVSKYPVEYSGNIDYLSNELRWLEWSGFSMQSFPPNFHPRKLVALKIPDSSRITRLWEGLKDFPILTSMDLKRCKSLKELPNFTGIPNLEELNLDHCESLVELHQSVGSLDKLVTLSLAGCYNLVKLPTKISLKSLIAMDLSDCPRLEEFPKVIGKMDSLRELRLSYTSVKELHPSIENLIGLRRLYLDNCHNLTTLPCSIYELQNLEILNVGRCSNLVTFPTKASISSHDHDSGSLALPKLGVLKINGCNLSTADFIGSLDCLETLTELDLSSNNFVNVPALSKFVNLPRIDLYSCKRLREIPELPPNIHEVNARDCESLERFLILPKSLTMLRMNLWNCHRFSYSLCYDMENILLNNQNNSRFSLVLPGSEVPKWFHCSKEVAANENDLYSRCAISFEIPSKLNWENIGVAVCSVSCFGFWIEHRADISINGVLIDQCSKLPSSTLCQKTKKLPSLTRDFMLLTYIPLSDVIKGKVDQKGWSRYHCRVQFYPACQMKSCGVHFVCQPPNEYSNKILMAAEPAERTIFHRRILNKRANDDHHHQQEQQEQPFSSSKRQCTEEQPSMAPIPDYSASARIHLRSNLPDF
ncbi:hypothetical protein ABKV19_025117 [Rosa sericea]